MTQKKIESDVRKLSMNVDHGGPFLIWDDDPSDKIEKGMIIDTLFCSDPECRVVHIHAILVDEQLKKHESEAARILLEHFDSANDKILPYQSLKAYFDIDTEELHVQDDMGVHADKKELLYFLDNQINKGLSEIFKRRWRATKTNTKDAWREKDWSWWRTGDLVSWVDVFPDDFNFLFSLNEKNYYGIDNYCVTPGCACNDVVIIFFSLDENSELGAVFTDTIKLKIKDVRPKQTGSKQDLLKCWDQINSVYPDLQDRLQKRHKEMKRVGGEIAKLSGNFKGPVVAQKKVKRNAPCPCGSGKKYKKCCMM